METALPHGACGIGPDGALDIDDLDRCLAEHASHIALLAVSGASNVTGVVQPVHELAEKVHAAGGRILVDRRPTSRPHRPIDMRAHDDPGHLDFVALAAHKMYAPYGTGAWSAPAWRSLPHPITREAARCALSRPMPSSGPTFPIGKRRAVRTSVGAIAMAAAIRTLTTIGLDRIAAHERELTRYAMDRLRGVPGLTVHGPADSLRPTDRVGVVPFTIAGIDHGLIAAVLGYEHGVAVRNGCFCAHPYIASLLDLSPADSTVWVEQAKNDDSAARREWFGSASAATTTDADVDVAVRGLEEIIAGE
jgi:selenocysteine lyase/cysteine desulfurase